LALDILRQESREYTDLWTQIDHEMKFAMTELGNELGLGLLRKGFLSMYWWYVSRKMVNMAQEGASLEEIENTVGEITQKISNDAVKLPFLRNRAERSLLRIRPWIQGKRVLDFGCGDGMLASKLGEKYHTVCADVEDLRAEENREIPFFRVGQEGIGTLPQVDTTILWTVLHHCDDPELIVRQITEITSSRIIIVEGYADNSAILKKNCFYDWYLNRPGKGQDVNVPLQYRTSKRWRELFEEVGWKLVHQQYLGVDEPIVPERHVLFVIEPRA
jgi:SAM-dependent methyltransferase